MSEASGFGENSTLLEINWNISDAPPQVFERKNELPVERLDVKKKIILRVDAKIRFQIDVTRTLFLLAFAP